MPITVKPGHMVVVLSDPKGQMPPRVVDMNGWDPTTLGNELQAFKNGVGVRRVLPGQLVGGQRQPAGNGSSLWDNSDRFFDSRNLGTLGWKGPVTIEPPVLTVNGEQVAVTEAGQITVTGSSASPAPPAPAVTPANTTPLVLNSYVEMKAGEKLPVVDIAPNTALIVVTNTRTHETSVVYGNQEFLKTQPLAKEIRSVHSKNYNYQVDTYYNGSQDLDKNIAEIANKFKKFNAAGIPSQWVSNGTRLTVLENGEVKVDDPFKHNLLSFDINRNGIVSGDPNDPFIDPKTGIIVSTDPGEPSAERKKLNFYWPKEGVAVVGLVKSVDGNPSKMGLLVLDPKQLLEQAEAQLRAAGKQLSQNEIEEAAQKIVGERVALFVHKLEGGVFNVLGTTAKWNGRVDARILGELTKANAPNPKANIGTYLDNSGDYNTVLLSVYPQNDQNDLKKMFTITHINLLGSQGAH